MSAIGVIGGSGFYSLLENAETFEVETPYGKPSSQLTTGKIGGKKVVFLSRHGLHHELPPHKVPYRANIWAMKELDARQILSTTAVGSLREWIKPGDFVVPDQFVNFTHNRGDTFYDGPQTTHISSADPFCPVLRDLLISHAMSKLMTVHPKGTAVIVQGPRFATKAESLFYRNSGCDIINMTMYPEMTLARELELCYANISLITDYDAGIKDNPLIKPVTLEDVLRVFNENSTRLKSLISEIIPRLPEQRNCQCARALEGARFSK